MTQEERTKGEWGTAFLFILSGLVLVSPRIPLPPSFPFPPSFTLNDLLDGLLLCIISLLWHWRNIERERRERESWVPLLLMFLKAIGSGAHCVANSTDILTGHDLRNSAGNLFVLG